MQPTSLTPQQIKLAELKKIFPEAFSEVKVDWEKLKATLGEDINFANERYVLDWAGKSDAVLAEKPQKVIALNRLFKDNDPLKTNTVLQMRDTGMTLVTI